MRYPCRFSSSIMARPKMGSWTAWTSTWIRMSPVNRSRCWPGSATAYLPPGAVYIEFRLEHTKNAKSRWYDPSKAGVYPLNVKLRITFHAQASHASFARDRVKVGSAGHGG